MVCVRCKIIVTEILDKLNISFISVELGRVELVSELTKSQKEALNTALQRYELELMDNPRKILVEQVKTSIVSIFHSSSDDDIRLKFSEYLSRKLRYDYTYLANTFSEVEGSTIERFYIEQKIQRVKELIVYNRMGIKEIAYLLNYSSVSHLCKQFKKVAGSTPATFKKEWETGTAIKKSNGVCSL
ncbi:MAG: AraC family transcriptional regulator [Chitinophagaceae bacterium]|nr:MAG: AraC family transcriptional regulator [Chitinophagaceae bacterium]